MTTTSSKKKTQLKLSKVVQNAPLVPTTSNMPKSEDIVCLSLQFNEGKVESLPNNCTISKKSPRFENNLLFATERSETQTSTDAWYFSQELAHVHIFLRSRQSPQNHAIYLSLLYQITKLLRSIIFTQPVWSLVS